MFSGALITLYVTVTLVVNNDNMINIIIIMMI